MGRYAGLTSESDKKTFGGRHLPSAVFLALRPGNVFPRVEKKISDDGEEDRLCGRGRLRPPYANINGAQLGGTNKIIINLDAEGGLLLRTAGHEVFHYLEQINADAAQKLRNFVVDHYVNEGTYESLAQKYAQQGYTGDIESELTADNLFDVMTQEGFLQRYASKDANTVRTLRNTVAAFIRHINNALQKLTLTNPIHREIYDSLTKDKQFMEELRQKATEALDSLPSAQGNRSVDNKADKTYNKTKLSSKANFNKLHSKVPIPKEQRLSVWNSIVERNVDYLRTKGDELPSEYYAYNANFVYFYYNNSSKDFNNFYVHSRISIEEKNRNRIEGRVKEIESIENARGYSDLVSFAGEDSEGRRKSDHTIHETKSNVNQKYDSVFKAKGREPSNDDISGSDGVRSQTGDGSDESVQENNGGIKPDTKFSLKAPVEEKKDLVAVHNFTTADLRNAAKLGGLAMPSIAILKSSQPHTRYGAISLVFRRNTIDPAADRRNAVYSGDAYTPTRNPGTRP